MLTVTNAAKSELKRILDTRRLAKGKCLRLVTPPQWVGEGDFGIGIDDVREDDLTVDHQGQQVLVVDHDLRSKLERAVLDFKPTPSGAAFTLDVF